MKVILLTLFYILGISNNDTIKVEFKDAQTKEELVGVKLEKENKTYYSDFDAYSYVDTGKYKINYISYKTIENIDIKKDTVIFLEKVE